MAASNAYGAPPQISYVQAPPVSYANEPQLRRSMNYEQVTPPVYEQNYNFPQYGGPTQRVPIQGRNVERVPFYGNVAPEYPVSERYGTPNLANGNFRRVEPTTVEPLRNSNFLRY